MADEKQESLRFGNVPKNDPPMATTVTVQEADGATAGEKAEEAAHAVAAVGTKKRVIAVDIDEVLGKFVLQLCAFHNANYAKGGSAASVAAAPASIEEESATGEASSAATAAAPAAPLTPEHFVSYNFHEVWGGTRDEADKKMRDFFESSYFVDGIPVIDDAARVLRKHSDNFELHVVTSRQHILQDRTREWIDAHYRGIFADLHFGNHFSNEGVVRSKPELCRSIGAVAIIDDNIRYATQCAAAGIPAYLFGDYAWNRTSEPLPENVHRTVSWAEVDAELDSILDTIYGRNGADKNVGNGVVTTISNGGGVGIMCGSSKKGKGSEGLGPKVIAAVDKGSDSGAGVGAGVGVGV